MKGYINRIGTRAECSPVIGGMILLVVMAILIYHFRHAIEVALIITALALLAGMAIYTAVAVTVAYRGHKAAAVVQAPQASAPAPVAQPVDVTDVLPPRITETFTVPDSELADVRAATGVAADGTIV